MENCWPILWMCIYMGALSLLLYFNFQVDCYFLALTPDNGLIEAIVWSSKNSLSKTKTHSQSHTLILTGWTMAIIVCARVISLLEALFLESLFRGPSVAVHGIEC